jgi:copper(I)-binding protein
LFILVFFLSCSSRLVWAHPDNSALPFAVENIAIHTVPNNPHSFMFEGTLRNLGGHTITIYGISSPQAKSTRIFRTVRVFGKTLGEQPVTTLRLENGVSVDLRPPDYRVILEGVTPKRLPIADLDGVVKPMDTIVVVLDTGQWGLLEMDLIVPSNNLVGQQQQVQTNPRYTRAQQSPNPSSLREYITGFPKTNPGQVQKGGGNHKTGDEPAGLD